MNQDITQYLGEIARKRWVNVPPEERKRIMTELSKKAADARKKKKK